jgi:hypothetical protein
VGYKKGVDYVSPLEQKALGLDPFDLELSRNAIPNVRVDFSEI